MDFTTLTVFEFRFVPAEFAGTLDDSSERRRWLRLIPDDDVVVKKLGIAQLMALDGPTLRVHPAIIEAFAKAISTSYGEHQANGDIEKAHHAAQRMRSSSQPLLIAIEVR